MKNNFIVARSLIEQALALWKGLGDKKFVAWSLSWLGVMACRQGEYARGRTLCEESLAMHREQGNKAGIAGSLFLLAWVLFITQGDVAMAHSLLEESAALFREVGDKMGIANYFSLSGQVALGQGNAVTARSLIEQALALFRETRGRQGTAFSLSLLARVEARQGNHATARALYEESLAMAARGVDEKGLIASCLEGLADLVAMQGQLAQAARFWGAAEVLRNAIGTPIPPVERANYERTVASARAHLGEKAFAAAWAEGRTMTPEQAFAAQGRMTASTPISAEQPSALPMKSTITRPDGLTVREVEVLRLIASGLSNAQVAERLVISPRTVDTHLTSIYSKIGVSSRSAATRYAIEHHLV